MTPVGYAGLKSHPFWLSAKLWDKRTKSDALSASLLASHGGTRLNGSDDEAERILTILISDICL
jgi:hypothetical protein